MQSLFHHLVIHKFVFSKKIWILFLISTSFFNGTFAKNDAPLPSSYCSYSINNSGLIINLLANSTSCYINNGSVTASVTGGDNNYTYLWSTGAITPTISNQATGNYSLTVTDGTGCTATANTVLSFNEEPIIEWQKTFGGSNDEKAYSIKQTQDGGFIVAGWSESNDGDVSGNNGTYDYWIVKLDNTGTLEWQKTFGGSDHEFSRSIQQTQDGGFIIAGWSNSNDGNVTVNNGYYDYWIIKLDNLGSLVWQKSYGGSSTERTSSIIQINDGRFVVTGSSYSNDGDVSGNKGNADSWILMLDNSGNLEWQKTYGGSDLDVSVSIQQTPDNGFIVVGNSSSNDGDVSGNKGLADYWLKKLDNSGNLLWQKTYGGSGTEFVYSIQLTQDGGYIVAGSSNSIDGDISANIGGYDYWIIKLDNLGSLDWEKSYGGSNDDFPIMIQQTPDGGFMAAGYSFSNDGDITGNNGTMDYWVIKLDNTGNLIWEKSLGGSGEENARAILQTQDGGIIVAGFTASNNGNVSGNHGNDDYWIVKLNQPQMPISIACAANNSQGEITTTGGVPPYTINWSNALGIVDTLFNGNGTDTLLMLADGNYNVTVTDANGCGETCTFIISTCALMIDISSLSTSCYINNGGVSATVSGGDGNYQYLWSTGATTPTISNQASGNYTLTVTDGTGCSATANTVLSFTGIPSIEWETTHGGPDIDDASSVVEISSGGYIVAGSRGLSTNPEYLIVKLDIFGNFVWERAMGNGFTNWALEIQETTDGGFIVVGFSSATGYNDDDWYIVKLNSFGTIEWQNTYGGSGVDLAYSIKQTPDGGFIVAGATDSQDGDVTTGTNGVEDVWVVKLDDLGTIEWQNTYGGSAFDSARDIHLTEDGGYIVGGISASTDGDVTGVQGINDQWVLKLDNAGAIEWQKTYGGTGLEYLDEIQLTQDGGYVTVGRSWSSDGDVTSNQGRSDYLIIKLDNLGNLIWSKSYGGSTSDDAHSIKQLADGTYIVAGNSQSIDGEITYNQGYYDFWLIKLDTNGDLLWQKTFGGSEFDIAANLQLTRDGGYIVCGYTDSQDGDISTMNNTPGISDMWIVKFNQAGMPISTSCSSDDSNAEILTTGGVPPYTINWSNSLGMVDTLFNGNGTDTLHMLADGNYNVTVTDANGCGETCSFIISTCQLSIDFISVSTSCYQDNGALTAMTSGGDGNYSYQWSTGASTPILTNLPEGGYEVTVTDGAGCSGTARSVVSFTSQPDIEWQHSFGGTVNETPYVVKQTLDGGTVIAGTVSSMNGDVTSHNGNFDYWVIKLDAAGNMLWQNTFGGSASELAYDIVELSDGFVVAGGASSPNTGQVTGNQGSYDVWIIKIDLSGNLLWQKTYGGQNSDLAYAIQQTPDGGFIVGARTNSIDGDITVYNGGADYWLLKLDNAGDLIWQKSYGGSQNEYTSSLQLTADGGYLIGGSSNSTNGDVSGNHGSYDYWVVKVDATGTIVWQKSLGGSGDDRGRAIERTDDNGYLIAGHHFSYNGDISVNHGNRDYWVVKLDDSGMMIWEKSFGGSARDEGESIHKTASGDFVLSGFSQSNNGQVSGNNGSSDFWVLLIDDMGNLIWQNSFGGQNIENSYSVTQASDGGFIAVGYGDSDSGDVSGNHGLGDWWVAKINNTQITYSSALLTTDPNCAYAPDGRLEATVTGGVSPYTYNWSNGVTTPVNSGLTAGHYEVTITDANNCELIASDSLTFTGVNCGVGIGVRVMLQGPYDPTSGLMSDYLRTAMLLPFQEPYTALGYQHYGGGGEIANPTAFDQSGPDAIVDWIFLELRDATDYTQIIGTRSALLQADGDIVDLDGTSAVIFYGVSEESYYVVARHRNHLDIMTPGALPLSETTTSTHDFTTGSAFGILSGSTVQVNLGGARFGLFECDFNNTGAIDAGDRSIAWNTRNQTGYLVEDSNFDGVCNAAERSNCWNNRNLISLVP